MGSGARCSTSRDPHLGLRHRDHQLSLGRRRFALAVEVHRAVYLVAYNKRFKRDEDGSDETERIENTDRHARTVGAPERATLAEIP